MLSKHIGRTFLRIISFACIIFSIGYAWHNISAASAAEASSQEINKQLQMNMPRQTAPSNDGKMAVETVSGVDYLGKLSIVSKNITLPVAANYSFEQMASTPTRYRGSFETNDLVICAHNYKQQFDPLRTIAMGEQIVVETVEGKKHSYVITNREVIKPTAVEEVVKEETTDKDWDLSLFTCTPGGSARVLIRCSLVEET